MTNPTNTGIITDSVGNSDITITSDFVIANLWASLTSDPTICEIDKVCNDGTCDNCEEWCATNTYYEDRTCKPCNNSCATCKGSLATDCLTCAEATPY